MRDVSIEKGAVNARSSRGVDLVSVPFDRQRRTVASPTKYTESQSLGLAMRGAGVELFRYPSARDPAHVTSTRFRARLFSCRECCPRRRFEFRQPQG